jgi:signal transduction histidine kinase
MDKPAALGARDFGRRVAAVLLLSTALTAVMAAAAGRTLTALARSKNALLDLSGRQMIAVDHARLAESQRVAAARGYLLTGDPAFHDRYLEHDRAFIAALARYGSLDSSAETRRMIRGIMRNYAEYRAEFEYTMELRRSGKSLGTVAARYETVVEPQRAEVDRILSALVAREAAQFERDRTRSDLATFRANALIYSVAAVLILAGLKMSSEVSGALGRTYERAQETARARGELKASQAAYRELEAVSYAISHNLRAPLRAIDAAARTTLSGRLAPEAEAERRSLEAVRGSVSRMSRMIESLLELLGVSSGPLTREPIDLSALLAAVLAESAARQARPPRLSVQAGLRCRADPRLLRIALEKLADNAVKFSSKAAAPRVEAGVEETERGPAFFVRDNGAGFDMSHAARLFVPFQRLHRPDEFPGAGMGLPVVGRIIERHGGRVWAEAAPGRGAAFYFTLP